MTIIGVSDETPAKVKSFLAKNRVNYLIAIGGAPGYSTRSLPTAWLINVDRQIVWQGHPMSLADREIVPHLADVRLRPTFTLPSALKSAERMLNAGRYAAGLRVIDTYLKKETNDHNTVREVRRQVVAYGERRIATAEGLTENGDYARAAKSMGEIEKAFRGTTVGDQARTKRRAWLRDPKVKAELDAAELLGRAEKLIARRRFKKARASLERLLNSPRFVGTKAREAAQKLMAASP